MEVRVKSRVIVDDLSFQAPKHAILTLASLSRSFSVGRLPRSCLGASRELERTRRCVTARPCDGEEERIDFDCIVDAVLDTRSKGIVPRTFRDVFHDALDIGHALDISRFVVGSSLNLKLLGDRTHPFCTPLLTAHRVPPRSVAGGDVHQHMEVGMVVAGTWGTGDLLTDEPSA